MSLGGCEFCDLVHVEQDKLLVLTNQLFIIEDINSASAERHILVCPIEHIESVEDLKFRDVDLIQEMTNLAQRYLISEHPGAIYRLGFDKPQQVSVYHLHLHVFVLPFQNKSNDQIRYGSMLISPDKVIDMITPKQKEKATF